MTKCMQQELSVEYCNAELNTDVQPNNVRYTMTNMKIWKVDSF